MIKTKAPSFNFLFMVFCFWIAHVQGLVLEEILSTDQGKTFFNEKKIGFYVGSFDPLHLGHITVIDLVLGAKLCDYILIYPVWGDGSSYRSSYKKRANVSLRNEMLDSIFRYHSRVITTKLTPKQLQTALTVRNETSTDPKLTVKPKFSNCQFIGIIGSDVALALGLPAQTLDKEQMRQKRLGLFMRGLYLNDDRTSDSVGTVSALPVETFIVAERRPAENISNLNLMIEDRLIIEVVFDELCISSTKIKKLIREGKTIDHLVDKRVLEIINKECLYHEN